ncbi:MAG: DUF937 domain-containing protein [Bacteroidetes bacterium]|nr:MAG: DUF937 domain-containing protein [Bacteroidota bacterium]
MSLIDMLSQQLTSGDALKNLSNQLGVPEGAAASAVSAALPMIVGALARNASKPEGASALDNALAKDHDGSILDNLGGFLSSPDNGPGPGILKHVFGEKRTKIEAGIGSVAGLDAGTAGNLLENLAPIVMGQLGKMKRSEGLDAGGLASILMGSINSGSSDSGFGGAAMSMLTNLLDQDDDGSIMDDVGGMLGGLFGKK